MILSDRTKYKKVVEVFDNTLPTDARTVETKGSPDCIYVYCGGVRKKQVNVKFTCNSSDGVGAKHALRYVQHRT